MIPNYTLHENVTYTADPHPRHVLDLLVPDKAARPTPLVLWIHGGGWRNGEKSFDRLLLLLENQGYALAAMNYRLSRVAPHPAQIQDCKAALRFLHKNAERFNIDTARICAAGNSAGGHLALLLGTTVGRDPWPSIDSSLESASDDLRCVIDFYAPTDITQWLNMGAADGRFNFPDIDDVMNRFLGGPIDARVGIAREASPTSYVGPETRPTLIVHGDNDAAVPIAQSELYYQLLKKAGVSSALYIVKGGTHGTGIYENPEVQHVVREYLKTQFGR